MEFMGVTIAAVVLLFAISGFFIVEEQTIRIIERFGKFHRVAEPGLRWRIPIIDRLVHDATLRIEEQEIEVQTITKDKVPV